MVQNDSQMVPNDFQMVPNDYQMVTNDYQKVPNDSKMVPNGHTFLPNGPKWFQNGPQWVPNKFQIVQLWNGSKWLQNGPKWLSKGVASFFISQNWQLPKLNNWYCLQLFTNWIGITEKLFSFQFVALLARSAWLDLTYRLTEGSIGGGGTYRCLLAPSHKSTFGDYKE